LSSHCRVLDCSALHPMPEAAILASEADSLHWVVKAMSVNIPSQFVLNLCIPLGQTKTLCVFFDVIHWTFLAHPLYLVPSVNQSIIHSICIRRHNSSVEMTSRRSEPWDQSRVNRWVFRAREKCSVEVCLCRHSDLNSRQCHRDVFCLQTFSVTFLNHGTGK